MLFSLGRTVATPGFMDLELPEGEVRGLLDRHVSGDWGTLDAEDKASNDAAVKDGSRILSAYITSKGVKVWLITEADRSASTLLLPDEY